VVWPIVVGVVLLAIAILAGTVMAVLGRLVPLRLAQRRLDRRLEQAAALQTAVEGLRDKALGVSSALEQATARAGRNPKPDAHPKPERAAPRTAGRQAGSGRDGGRDGGAVPPRTRPSRMKRSG
jgi:type II secretory pathway pseudopilin PulG